MRGDPFRGALLRGKHDRWSHRDIGGVIGARALGRRQRRQQQRARAQGHGSGHAPAQPRCAAAQPTPDEAQAALKTYGSAYFGPYEVSEAERYEVTRQLGTTTPGEAGLAVRHLEFVGGNRVILKPPPEVLDGKLVQGYVNWERVTPAMKPAQ